MSSACLAPVISPTDMVLTPASLRTFSGAPHNADVAVESTPPPRAERASLLAGPVVETTRAQVSADDSPALPDALDVRAREPLPASQATHQRAAAADVAPHRQEKAMARDSSELAGVSRAASVTPGSALRHAPLREHVREQRVGPPGPPPTIVHVTIDRIDVRPPATSAAPERAVSRPRKDSWKSLGEYLRQRERPNGGAL